MTMGIIEVVVPKRVRDEETYEKLFNKVRTRDRAKKYERLLGNRRERKAVTPEKRQEILLTVRRDALKTRENILKGDRREALADVDWLIDNLDNMLAEGC